MLRTAIRISQSRTALVVGLALLPAAVLLKEVGIVSSVYWMDRAAVMAALVGLILCAGTTYAHEVKVSRLLAAGSLVPWTLTVAWLIYFELGGSAWTAIVPLGAHAIWFLIWRRIKEPKWFDVPG